MSFVRSRTRTVLLAIAFAVALYGVVGAFVVPPIAKKLLASNLGERLGRVVQVDDIAINPYTLQGRLKGLRILEPDGKSPFASFDALDVDASAASFYHRAPVIDGLTLQGLKVHVIRDGASHYNLSDILERLKSTPQTSGKRESSPSRFSVGNIRVVDAAVDFDDRPNGLVQRVSAIQLAVPLVSNLPRNVKNPVQPSFSANVNGTPVKLTGEALPFERTIRTSFNLDIHALDLPRYLAYLPSSLPARVDAGKLDARIALRLSQAPGKDPAVDVSGTASVDGVSLSNAEGPLARFARLDVDIASLDPVGGAIRIASVRVAGVATMRDAWKIGSAEARDVAVDLRTHAVRVASIATEDGALALTRNADGSIDMPRLASASDPGPEPAAQWKVAIDKVALAGYTFTVADASVKPAVTHRVAIARLDASDLSSEGGFSGKATAKATLDRGGAIDASSTFALDPLRVNVVLDAQSIDLVPLRAYVAQFPAVALKSGAASAKGTLDLANDGGAMRIAYSGSARIDHLATLDTIDREELLDWKSVSARGVRLAVVPGKPLELAAGDVTVDGAYSRIVVMPDGKLNLQKLIGATPEEPEAAPAATPARARDIRIERITFKGSRLNFTDHYIRPNYTADVGELDGSVTHLSSEPSSRASVALAGRWNAKSPVVIAGTVNPLAGDLFLDIAAKGEDIDLTKLTAYSQRYAGYGITDGRLTLDVRYHLENGKLEGRNRILVDQLAFGEKVESPDATKLPVLFAINLLKDRNGRINLVLPVSGSLEDPQFDIGAVIAQIFSSPLKAAQSSPFSLITAGAGGGDDLAFVEFEPGLATLTPAAQEKLATLVKVLDDRPGLKIEIAARVDAAKDVAALEAAERERRLAAAPKDLPKEAREKLAAEPIVIGEAELAALSAARAEGVKAYLSATGRLAPERVLVATTPAKAANDTKARLSRVDFALR